MRGGGGEQVRRRPRHACSCRATPRRGAAGRGVPAGGAVLDRTTSRVGTSVVSPAHGPIALALVRREAEPGATLAVGSGETTATVVELPFA